MIVFKKKKKKKGEHKQLLSSFKCLHICRCPSQTPESNSHYSHKNTKKKKKKKSPLFLNVTHRLQTSCVQIRQWRHALKSGLKPDFCTQINLRGNTTDVLPGDILVSPLLSSNQSGLHHFVPPPQVKHLTCGSTQRQSRTQATSRRGHAQRSKGQKSSKIRHSSSSVYSHSQTRAVSHWFSNWSCYRIVPYICAMLFF